MNLALFALAGLFVGVAIGIRFVLWQLAKMRRSAIQAGVDYMSRYSAMQRIDWRGEAVPGTWREMVDHETAPLVVVVPLRREVN